MGSFEKLEPDNVGTPPRRGGNSSPNKQHKGDRRPWWQRAQQFIRQNIQLPTLGYQTIGGLLWGLCYGLGFGAGLGAVLNLEKES